MNLRGLISISGKPGLFKLIGKNKSSFILETLDAKKTKTIADSKTSKISSLEDITIYANEGDLKLEAIFERMKSAKSIPDTKTADNAALSSFFSEVAPAYDTDRVYMSDIKKVINWFNFIKDLPLFTEAAPEALPNNETLQATEAEKKLETAYEKKQKTTKPAVKSATRLSQKSK